MNTEAIDFFLRHERAQNQLQCDELHLELIFASELRDFQARDFGNDHVFERPENLNLVNQSEESWPENFTSAS